MCASVEVILKREFGSSLSTLGVQILDPCVGTGNFIVNLIQKHISGGSLACKYENDLFCNEIMLLPYYIASLNIEHAYYERMGQYKSFEGIAFADTLNLEGQQMELFSERNTERIQREKQAQIMVVIGNPPYNVGQSNENDNNKNRRYPVIDKRVYETYMKESKATNTRAVSDAYVKFFRWATDRLGTRDGIVCLVTNNSFLNGIAFDGFRKRLSQEFTHIYAIDLGGNARRQGGGNVFGIMVGVSIAVLVRSRKEAASPYKPARILYYKVDEDQRGSGKLKFLLDAKNIDGIVWQELQPDTRYMWLTENISPEFDTFLPIGTKEAKATRIIEAKGVEIKTVFKIYSRGAETTRDSWMYDFKSEKLVDKASRMIETYNAEISRWIRSGSPKDIDHFVINDEAKIKWSSRLKECFTRKMEAKFTPASIRNSLYRPFTKQFLYYDSIMTHRQGMFPSILPTISTEDENCVLVVSDHGYRAPFSAIVTNVIPDLHLLATSDAFQCFSYYTYSEDEKNRRENITDWALAEFRGKYGTHVSKWDIFYYVYALLHHPQYRERYAENLKRDLPRIPLLGSQDAFETCVRIGKQLMGLHLHYEKAQEYPLTWQENKDVPITWRVEKMRLPPDKSALKVNEWLTLADIPQECYQYRLGNRSALEWVIDQYQVSTDARSGIVSDPNREDDEQYIVRLVGKVVTVSVETVKLVEELAQKVKQEDWLDEGQGEVSRPKILNE